MKVRGYGCARREAGIRAAFADANASHHDNMIGSLIFGMVCWTPFMDAFGANLDGAMAVAAKSPMLAAAADGLSMLVRLRLRWPMLPVVVLTMAGNGGVLRAILDTGVLGLLNKSDALNELPLAIRAVERRRRYLGVSIRQLLDAGTGIPAAQTTLSPRETEVLRLFASGLTVSAIARRLNRSVKTVSRQKQDAMAKLGLHSDLEVYAYARENGLAF